MKANYTGDLKDLIGRGASEKDANKIIKETGVIRLEDDQENIIHAKLNYSYKDQLLSAIQNCPAAGMLRRTSTINELGKHEIRSERFLEKKVIQQSFTFGYRPPQALRREFACSSAKANQDPVFWPLIKRLAVDLEQIYKKYSPEVYEVQKKYVSEIKPIWRIADTVFTSGIVNLNYNINYHHDAANWKDVHSVMLVLSGGHEGGNLILPKYKTGLELKDKSVLIFNGSKILHGVTPLSLPEKSHRISIVFYAMKQLCKCGTKEEEQKKFKETANRIAIERTKCSPEEP